MDGGQLSALHAMGDTALAQRVLFVDHSSKIAGAELVLLDVIQGCGDTATVFLFQDGPLVEAIRARGVAHLISRRAGDLSAIRRDGGLGKALPRLAGLLGAVREIWAEARSHDVIYANSQKAFVLSALARTIRRRPLIWHLHDILTPAHFGRAQIRLVIALANRLAKRVIVPSTSVADAFVAAGGRSALIRVIPNGVDVVRPVNAPDVLRAELGLPSGFLFGVFSRLAPWKGQNVAIEALAMLPQAHCAIVGDAQFGETDYAQSLRDRASSLGVADRVHFLGHRSEVAALMSAVDAVVHPSVDPEPFGRTLVEAMALGIPLIATDCGAAAQILANGACGRLVKPGDAGALAAALTTVRDDPGAWTALVVAAETRARVLYNATAMRRSIHEAIAECAMPDPTRRIAC